ncbi:MAG: hypothetical protein IJT79_05655 [Ruminococcus sp.]|nr:hypothetical protein [Ruminococcus sp.]
MKKSIPFRLLSVLLAIVLTVTMFTTVVSAADETGGKYIKDVFVAYGEKKADAEKWLKEHGWQPFADLNDGKNSKAKTDAVAVLGIKRTNKASEAITDMATMFMKGGYSFDAYENLVAQKKADINEFINSFVPALKEYRINYAGKGSSGGKKRAKMARDLLNKFYDGDPNDKDAVNDTGKPIGDLLLKRTKTEIGDEAYNALSQEEKMKTADLQQIILESSGPAILMLEQTLALATDTSTKSWLQRLDGLTGDDLVKKIGNYAPEAKGQDLAPSAAMSLLAAHFEDYSKKLAKDWVSVHEDILWYEQYCKENGLRQEESGEDNEKVEKFFNDLKKSDESRYNSESQRFVNVDTYYSVLKKTAYSGEWGNTLYDFLCPKDNKANYSTEIDFFAPIAAALSEGQRAALEFLNLTSLLKLGMDSSSAVKAEFPSTAEIFKDEDGNKLESISIYSGINRAIFRNGVALTSNALMQKSLGKDPYDIIWNPGGVVDIVSYVGMGIGAITLVTGAVMFVKTSKQISYWAAEVTHWTQELNKAPQVIADVDEEASFVMELLELKKGKSGFNFGPSSRLADAQKNLARVTKLNVATRWMMGIGGALMLLSAALKGAEMYMYYHRDFSVIPRMIVDEANIVTRTKDEDGNVVEHIDFDHFDYYTVAKCNRQEVGIHTSAQNGVSDYKSWGCGDAADLNADVGLQWLALYVNRAGEQGKPILADTLKLQKGKEGSKAPAGYNGCLHMFASTNPVKIDDTAFCYRDDNDGMYLFWQTDANAYPSATASVFNVGLLALVGIGGLALGILGTTLIMLPKIRKRKNSKA